MNFDGIVNCRLFALKWFISVDLYDHDIVGVREYLYDHETLLKTWGVGFENNYMCARLPTLRAKSIFLMIMKISYENVDV